MTLFALPIEHIGRLKRFKDFIRSQAHAERQAKIVDKVLGSAWFLLGPILEMSVYYFLVVVVFNRSTFGDIPTFLGIMTGLIHYRTFQGTVQRSINSIVANRQVQLQVRIEPMTFVTIAVLRQLLDSRYYLIIFLAGLIAYRFVPPVTALFYPFVLLLLLLATWSVSLLVASAFVYLRDLQLVTQTALRIGVYACPIIYPLTFIPEAHRAAYLYNPFATLFALVQATLLGLPFPSAGHIAWCVAFFLALLFIAHQFYNRHAPQFTKVI